MHTNKLKSDSSPGRVQNIAAQNVCFMSSENMKTTRRLPLGINRRDLVRMLGTGTSLCFLGFFYS